MSTETVASPARRDAPGVVVPFSAGASREHEHVGPQDAPHTAGPLLAVVLGTPLDNAVVDLAALLSGRAGATLYLLYPQVVPPALPLAAASHVLAATGGEAVLERALAHHADDRAVGVTLICRALGPAVAEEAAERGCAGIVIGAPQGGWLARRRIRQAGSYLMRHATCPTYVVHDVAQEPAAEPAHAVAVLGR